MIAQLKNLLNEHFHQEMHLLHRPVFTHIEKENIIECIDSNYVSSVGKMVDKFEEKIAKKLKVEKSVLTVNGTSALHVSLLNLGVKEDDEVITQSLTFIATVNAISYTGASPIFLDVSNSTLSLCPEKLKYFLEKNCKYDSGKTVNKFTNKRISACVIMHTFGIPGYAKEVKEILDKYNIHLLEDCAESFGSLVDNKPTGLQGELSILSFNGNKIITTGGGGAVFSKNTKRLDQIKHLTTTAKKSHKFEFDHDKIGFNYRMPNINAALGCAQIENLDYFLRDKIVLRDKYKSFFEDYSDINLVEYPKNTKPNNWLISILMKDKKERDSFLEESNKLDIQTRPIWKLISSLSMYKDFQKGDLENSKKLEERIVCLPSSARDINE